MPITVLGWIIVGAVVVVVVGVALLVRGSLNKFADTATTTFNPGKKEVM